MNRNLQVSLESHFMRHDNRSLLHSNRSHFIRHDSRSLFITTGLCIMKTHLFSSTQVSFAFHSLLFIIKRLFGIVIRLFHAHTSHTSSVHTCMWCHIHSYVSYISYIMMYCNSSLSSSYIFCMWCHFSPGACMGKRAPPIHLYLFSPYMWDRSYVLSPGAAYIAASAEHQQSSRVPHIFIKSPAAEQLLLSKAT